MENKIKELKNIQLDMLKEFVSICNKHNLKYFLLGGSCLGAVRHKGYIPWDDDIDVGLPREDYKKFIEIAPLELPSYLFIQTHETDSEYFLNFAKMRNSNTTYIEEEWKNFKINHGIFMDIFPLDGMTDNKSKRKIFLERKKIYYVSLRENFYRENNEVRKKTFKNKIAVLFSYFYRDNKKTVLKREKLYQKYKYEDSSLIANHNGAWGEKEIVPKHYFGEGVKAIFDGIEVNIPENYDMYLTSLYGDYMTPPPPEKQIGHHDYVVLDTQNSYKKYCK